MSYSEEKFNSLYSRMELFQKIAAQNGYELKELLMKKVGAEPELAAALIAAWEARPGKQKQAPAAAPRPALDPEQFTAYVKDMSSFQRLAGMQGLALRDWLQVNCALDGATADELIAAAGISLRQKETALMDVLHRPLPEIKPAAPPAGQSIARGKRAEDDMVISISGVPEEAAPAVRPAAECHDREAQIDRLHTMLDNSQHKEPIQLIQELKSIRLKKDYLKNSVSPEERDRAERLLREREEQKKKLLKTEQKIEELRQNLSDIKSKPPKLFGREDHRQKMQTMQEETARLEKQLASISAKESERQSAYLAAVACIERHAAAKRAIEAQYRDDEGKFKAAKDVIIQALLWENLDLPADILAGTVIEHLTWYESFFKAFPEKIQLPVHGWIKACNIVAKLAFDFPLWHSEIENIHFVVDTEMRSLKDSIRLFLSGFVESLREPFQAVTQLNLLLSEAEKTGGQAVQDMACRMAQDVQAKIDGSVIEFCSRMLASFYIIQAVAEYLNYEVQVKKYFEQLDHAGGRPARQDPGTVDHMKSFIEFSEASARILEHCFNATDEVRALSELPAAPGAAADCKAVILADFEKLFSSARLRLQRY